MTARRPMKKPIAVALLGMASVVVAAAALAAGTHVDVNNGHELARAWCRGCHAIEARELEGPYADVPSFTAIARQSSTTATSLRVFLTTPHGDMPDIELKPGQIDDLVDYILSLNEKS